jgi:catechol 2,3-dioxygenase-like lactoylglutathione lyase family enzyme
MLKDATAFSGFAVDDLDAASAFYTDVLGLDVTHINDTPGGLLQIKLAGGAEVMVYPKPDFVPATYTILNFAIPDVDAAVDQLTAKGVSFERYDGFDQDEKGVSRIDGAPPIAWFTDPAGNIMAVVERNW